MGWVHSTSPFFRAPSRRQLLTAGVVSALGAMGRGAKTISATELSVEQIRPRVKSVVLIYLQGGPPTQDMFDMKPHAPNGVGGEFKPISTDVPGVQVSEHLPKTSRWMGKSAVIRSVFHDGGCHKNLPMYTGYDFNLPDEEFRNSDPPSMGSVCAYLERDQQKALPTYAYLPCPLGWGETRKKAGPHGGFLGPRYDPVCTECTAFVDHPPDDIWKPQTLRGEPHLVDIVLREGLSSERIKDRRAIMDRLGDRFLELEARGVLGNLPSQRRLAFDILTSPEVREAFDLSREADTDRDRYGRTLFGSSLILARRLVQRGVKFVNVSWDNFSKRFEVSKAAWDTHERNFPMLRETLLPNFDQSYSAFLEDLHARGLLDQTLVVTMGEMGRTPRINPQGGRDHWTQCYSVLFAGAGIQQGMIHGASDEQAAYIKDKPVHIRDVVATIYYLLGIDPEMPVHDRSGRPVAIAHSGKPVREIIS